MNLTPGQKKVFGIILIVLFLPIQLFLFTLFIVSFVNGEDAVTQFSFVFTIGIFVFPLWQGVRLWKAGSTKPPMVPDTLDFSTTETSGEVLLKLSAKIELPDYRKLLFYLTYTTPTLIFLHFIGISMLLFFFLNGEPNFFMLFICLFLLFLPISVYRTSVSNYKTTKTIHETQVYEFTADNVIVTGQTSNFTIQWRSLHKVKETKHWFLLYVNKQSAMLIPKKSFASHSDLDEFRRMTRRVIL